MQSINVHRLLNLKEIERIKGERSCQTQEGRVLTCCRISKITEKLNVFTGRNVCVLLCFLLVPAGHNGRSDSVESPVRRLLCCASASGTRQLMHNKAGASCASLGAPEGNMDKKRLHPLQQNDFKIRAADVFVFLLAEGWSCSGLPGSNPDRRQRRS